MTKDSYSLGLRLWRHAEPRLCSDETKSSLRAAAAAAYKDFSPYERDCFDVMMGTEAVDPYWDLDF